MNPGREPMNIRPLLLFTLLASSLAIAGPPPAPVRTEIDALLAALGSSGCEFYRNGTWHNGTEARKHLLTKLNYLEKRNAVKTTEDFIELAASSSSMSGKPYQVRCPGSKTVESKEWLHSQLKLVRAPSGAASAARK
jgi:hypothetical protein